MKMRLAAAVCIAMYAILSLTRWPMPWPAVALAAVAVAAAFTIPRHKDQTR